MPAEEKTIKVYKKKTLQHFLLVIFYCLKYEMAVKGKVSQEKICRPEYFQVKLHICQTERQ